MAVEYDLTAKQERAFLHLISTEQEKKLINGKMIDVYKKTSVLYGGAKGGGKSFLFCLWVYHWCIWLIKFFDIKEIEFPLPVGFIGRKRSVDFGDTTLETWKKIIPASNYRIREHDKEIIIKEKVKISFGGLDDQKTVNKFNSAELAFMGIDQAEETDRVDVSVLEASLRLKYEGKEPPYKIFYSANPAECWLKDAFITNPRRNHYYIKALPTDNPHLPHNYIETLEDSFADDESLLRAYRDGDWDILGRAEVLITSAMLENLKKINFNKLRSEVREVIVCDPATGGDECVVYCMKDNDIKAEKFLHTDNTMIVVGEIMSISFDKDIINCAVDCIGIGKGVADRLDEQKRDVIYIDSARNSWKDRKRFKNLRAEMWWYTANQIRKGLVPYPKDPELRRQLVSVKRRIVDSNGKIQIESKKDIKSRIGRSPDRADAFVYGIWALSQVDPVQIRLPSRDEDAWKKVKKQVKKKHEYKEQYVGM